MCVSYEGLLGDATEDMVDKLGDGEGTDVDEEEVYQMAATLETCNGLDAILARFVSLSLLSLSQFPFFFLLKNPFLFIMCILGVGCHTLKISFRVMD